MSLIGRLLRLLTGESPGRPADAANAPSSAPPATRPTPAAPASPAVPAAPERDYFAEARAARDLPRKTLKPLVLVVDDDEGFRSMVADFVESLGLRVTVAADGWQAVVQSQGLNLTLIITDVQMPGPKGTGLDAYKGLRESPHVRKDMPIVFLTGMDPDRIRPLIPNDPKVRLLFKPLDQRTLYQAIIDLTNLRPTS